MSVKQQFRAARLVSLVAGACGPVSRDSWFGPVGGGGAGGGGWGACGLCPKSRARRASHLPRFILLGSFSDNLLVVSILDIVYNCHL